MPPKAPKVGKGKGKLPPWMLFAALGVGLLAFIFLRGKGSSPTQVQSVAPAEPDTSGLMGAGSGQPLANAAPADSLAPDILAALGYALGEIGSQGNALASIAMNANDNLGYVSSTALAGSFALAGQSVSGAFELGGKALEAGARTIYEGTPVATRTTQPTLESGPIAPPAAPAPRVTKTVPSATVKLSPTVPVKAKGKRLAREGL